MNILGISTAIEAAGKAIDSVFTTDEERLRAQAALETIRQKPELMQIMVNSIEAQHPNIFVSGWRPAVGWICVMGLGYTFLLRPIMEFILNIAGIQTCVIQDLVKSCGPFSGPAIDTASLLALVISMLGVSGLRTYEKKSGVAR